METENLVTEIAALIVEREKEVHNAAIDLVLSKVKIMRQDLEFGPHALPEEAVEWGDIAVYINKDELRKLKK